VWDHHEQRIGRNDGDLLTPDFKEREPIRVGADPVQVWTRDADKARKLRVDIDGWTGHLSVSLGSFVTVTTSDEPLPDEHLPAAAEMLVKMIRDLKGPSR
jgi:hypothetical protein